MPATAKKSKSKSGRKKMLGRCTNREKEDYERRKKDASLGRCPEAFESRSIFLRLHPKCDTCVEGSKACTLSRRNSSSLRCQECRSGKRRCPRQIAFEIYFIAKMMSKSQDWVATVYNSGLADEASANAATPTADTSTADSANPGNQSTSTQAMHMTADPQAAIHETGEMSSSGAGTQKPAAERTIIDLSIDMSDMEGPDEDTKMGVKNEPKQEERGMDLTTHCRDDPMNVVDQAVRVVGKVDLVKLNKKLALCRSFLFNAFNPFSGDLLASNVGLVLQKLEITGQDFSQALYAEDAASMEDLIGELAVCRDRLCRAVGQFEEELDAARIGEVNKMKRHLDTLKEILQEFSASLDKEGQQIAELEGVKPPQSLISRLH